MAAIEQLTAVFLVRYRVRYKNNTCEYYILCRSQVILCAIRTAAGEATHITPGNIEEYKSKSPAS